MAALVAAVVVVRLVGEVDWEGVRHAFGHLTWWQPVVLLALLLPRQVVNALPLALYIDGVSAYRATVNDLGAILMSMVAPPPSDVALRVAMFSSWGVPTSKGLAGTVMNTLTFYVVRFGTPAVGFVLLAVDGRKPGLRWVEVLSVAVATTILVGVLLVVRSDRLAREIGTRAARVTRRVRRTTDPDRWAAACADFRVDIAARFRRGFPRSVLAVVGFLAVDLTMLVLALRFAGVPSASVGLLAITIAYLFAYPFTLFPATGLGVVDALVLAALVEAGGTGVEAPGIAGLVVWRVLTVGGPVLLGVGAVALWRRTASARPAQPASD